MNINKSKYITGLCRTNNLHQSQVANHILSCYVNISDVNMHINYNNTYNS